MNIKKDWKFLCILGLLAMACFVSWRLYFNVYTQEDKVNIHLFPKAFDGWVSEEMTITEDEYKLLETRNAFARKYTSESGQVVYLLIVYSESNRKVSHPPEICYTGNGITVLSNYPVEIKVTELDFLLTANRLELEQRAFSQLAYYWFKIGKDYTDSYWRQQIMIALKTLMGNPPSSALIRVSSTIKDNNKGKTEQDIQEFTKTIIPYLLKYLP